MKKFEQIQVFGKYFVHDYYKQIFILTFKLNLSFILSKLQWGAAGSRRLLAG
jgi:hypothetical protein